MSISHAAQAVTEADIVIAGGGMAGSMLAYVLQRQLPQLKLVVIEQQPAGSPSVSFDSRSIALAAGSVDLLKEWQLWPALATNACPITDIQVSDRGHFGKAYLHAADYQQAALGQVLEVEYLGALLQQKLAQTDIRLWQPDQITELTAEREYQYLRLQSGRQLRCRLLVVAEGGQSPTRQLAGFSLTEQDYGQSAVIANLAVTGSHQNKAYERFTANGPIALLPLSRQRYSLVWTTTPQQATDLMQLPQEHFLAEIQQAFGYRAGVFSRAGQRASYPLSLRRTDQVVRHRVALLGNSLHNIHPIAGQGFNLALRDIDGLVRQLCQPEALADPGSYQVLRRYEQARQPDMQRVMYFTDALVRGFSNHSRMVALARNIGLFSLLLFPSLRQPLAMQAMGFRS